MTERFRPPALAGFYDPRGRLERHETSALVKRALGGGAVAHADSWLVAGTTAEGGSVTLAGGCAVLEGRLENRSQLSKALGLEDEDRSEVLLAAAFGRWRAEMLPRLRGSYVAVLWDSSRRSGLVAIDQLGGRSLFFRERQDGSLAFASEQRVLLDLLSQRPTPNESAVARWLLELALPRGETLYDGVKRLDSGSLLELTEGWRSRTYWFPSYERPDARVSFEDAAAALWAQVVQAVDAKTDAGDRPALILSGGIDSSVVAAASVEAALRGKPLPLTYSAVFPGDDRIDESERIQALAEALDLTGVQMRLEPSGALAIALDYVDTWGLPLPGPGAALEQPLVERAAAEGANVIFDGQAGDEIFGRPSYLIADRVRQGRLLASARLAASYPPPPGISRYIRWRGAYRIWKMAGLQGAIPGRLHSTLRNLRRRDRPIPSWLALPSGTFDPRAPDPWSWKGHPGPRWWAHQAHVVARMRDSVGVNDYIRHRAAVVGASARPPLLDVDLIELSLRLPPRLSFDGRFPDRPLIREALRGKVPDTVRLNGVKSNVAAFYYETLAGPDGAPIRRLLCEGDVQVGAYVDREAVAGLLASPPGMTGTGWYDWFSAVWKLTSIEAWLRQEADPSFAARMRTETDVVPTTRADHRVRN